MNYIVTNDDERLELGDGTYLLLIQRNVKLSDSGLEREDYARNVWRMRDSGEEIWRIRSERDYMGSSYIQLYMRKDPSIIARWDSSLYDVDLDTGWAEQGEFIK